MPLSSTPMRTLPPVVTLALAASLSDRGAVTVCLNDNQQQGRLYRRALALPETIPVIDVYPSVGDCYADSPDSTMRFWRTADRPI